jgi:GDPmannose 4,6-dehydratase
MRKALITGISGQDGSYLAEILLAKGYEVHGIALPRQEVDSLVKNLPNICHLNDQIEVHFFSLLDAVLLRDLVCHVQPDECYHLGAASFVDYAFEAENQILETNIGGTHNLLAALKEEAPGCRLFFAGTSEMFGEVSSSPQDESTPFNPRSIYGISKVAGHHLVAYYRKQYNLWAATGLLFNHESPRRGERFVTRKITSGVARIKLGLMDKLFLGNLEASRDWGYAPDYADAMWRMLQQDEPEDFLISTGILHTVKEFVSIAFSSVGLDFEKHVAINPEFFREVEKIPLCGNCERIKKKLGWQPKVGFRQIVEEMVTKDLELVSMGLFNG